jgi:A/G-specific adenine glycosylase
MSRVPDREQDPAVVLGWYASHGRDLAFRRTTDPWAVLVSEVMAQQTQASRAAEAWTRFMSLFPTPAALAAASPAAVIRAWRGLGYNRRALALRRAAIEIVEVHGGLVPPTLDALVALPGIGPYTARAVLAIAFGVPVAALDVNIRRVVGRAYLPGQLAPRELQAAADALVPIDRAADWTHALMDIGAAFCRPHEPHCPECPLVPTCRYARDRPASTAPAPTGERAQRTTPRFESTNRWLRGRILDRLRDAPDGIWVTFDDAIGAHDASAVSAAVAALASEGLLETSGSEARLSPT